MGYITSPLASLCVWLAATLPLVMSEFSIIGTRLSPPDLTCYGDHQIELPDQEDAVLCSNSSVQDVLQPGNVIDNDESTVWYSEPGGGSLFILLDRHIHVTNIQLQLINEVEFGVEVYQKTFLDSNYKAFSCTGTNNANDGSEACKLNKSPQQELEYFQALPFLSTRELFFSFHVNGTEPVGIKNIQIQGSEVTLPECLAGCNKDTISPCMQMEDKTLVCGCESEGVDGTRCRCRGDGGAHSVDLSKAGVSCEPYVTSVIPNHGPRAGGTIIEIRGRLLRAAPNGPTDGSVTLTLGDKYHCDCDIDSHLDWLIRCRTPPVEDTDFNQPLAMSLTVHWGDTQVDLGEETFRYEENPVVTGMEPYATFIEGGVVVTIHGNHLQSVYKPTIHLLITHHTSEIKLYSEGELCVPQQASMTCKLPSIDLGNTRKKREAHPDYDNNFRCDVLLLLDGVQDYLNLTGPPANLGEFYVYKSPEFDLHDGTITHKPYQGSKTITLTGRFLGLVARQKDYTIYVDNKESPCEIGEFTNTSISCTLPNDEPSGTAPYSVIVEVGSIKERVAKVEYENSLIENPAFTGGLFGGLAAVVVASVVCALVCYMRRQEPEPEWLKRLSEDSRRLARKKLISTKALNIKIDNKTKTLGAGQFGEVYMGYYTKRTRKNARPVAVKNIKDNYSTSYEKVEEFVKEGLVMINLGHRHVLPLVGIATDTSNGKPQIVVPFMENGSLKEYLCRHISDLAGNDQLKFSTQIARGMAYLMTRNIVHRDLAARNCLLDEHLDIKISDYGCARLTEEGEYYRPYDKTKPMPYKWMPPEALDMEDPRFNEMSDVWAYGVTIWEVYTCGQSPYVGVNGRDMPNLIAGGYRLDPPKHTPEGVQSIMRRCWAQDSHDRPRFSEIVRLLETEARLGDEYQIIDERDMDNRL